MCFNANECAIIIVTIRLQHIRIYNMNHKHRYF